MNNNNQLVPVLVAALIVLSGVSTISGQALAQSQSDDCEISPVTGKQVCYEPYGDINGETTEEIWLSMHVQSESMHDRYERYTTEKSSISNLTTGMQTEEGIVAFVQAYNSGKSVAEAKAEAYKEVNDMASGWQASVAHEQTAQAEMARVVYETANGTAGMGPYDVFQVPNHNLVWADRTYTLYNGTEINVTQVGSIDTYWHNNEPKDDYVYTYYDGNYSYLPNTSTSQYYDSHSYYLSALNVKGPESTNGSTVHAMDAQRVQQTLEIINENRKVALDNVGAFGDSFAAQYDRDEVKAEEVMSPAYRMNNHATDYASTGHYAYLLFAAQDRGMAVNIDTGFTVTFNQSGPMDAKTIDGGLYASSGTFPNDTIESGVQYDTSNLNGSVWVIDASTSQQYALNGTFTVDEMRDIDDNGTVVNQTSLQDSSFATRSADGFKEDVEDWQQTHRNITKNITYVYPGADDGGSGGVAFDGSTKRLAIVAGILLGGAALLSGRRDDDYRR